jgi:F-type H+-transporting ATPase subunit a
MRLSPDEIIFWQHGFFKLNATIFYTWALMLVLVVGAKLITRKLSTDHMRSRWQNLLEIVVTGIEQQIADVGLRHPRKYIGFLGTLFLFVAMASLWTVIPGYEPPTGSLSTTAALALCVMVAVPLFGIEDQGLAGYLKSYLKPTVVMLPFNIISEISRTLALAVRLFGNMMSGAMIIGILLSITPFIFPIVLTLLGLLRGMVLAYIFSILAAVYIAAATHVRKPKPKAELAPKISQQLMYQGFAMDSMTIIAVASIVIAGITTGFGTMGPAFAEGRAVATALTALAQQPDASATITRTLFVGLAMIESTAIYCFVVSMILIFANPFWNHAIALAAGN